jgi:hypothetical protein
MAFKMGEKTGTFYFFGENGDILLFCHAIVETVVNSARNHRVRLKK